MMTRIRKRILILSLMLFCGGALAGCASNQAGGPGAAGSTADSEAPGGTDGSETAGKSGDSGNAGNTDGSGNAATTGGSGQSGKTAGSASSGKIDEAKLAGWDHIAMKAAPDTPAAVVEGDAGIIEARLASYAGEGQYVLEVSQPENPGDGAGIDIWLEPSLKGKEDLTETARTYISSPIRFAIYDNDTGYLDLNEDQFLDLAPSDFARIEETGSTKGNTDGGMDNGTNGGTDGSTELEMTLEFSKAFLAKNRARLEAWQDRIILIPDIRMKDRRSWLEGVTVNTWLLTPTADPAIYTISSDFLSEDLVDFLLEHLPKEPLAGAYTTACQPAINWDEKEIRTLLEEAAPEEGALLCTREELHALSKETVIIPLIQMDRNMDAESRGQLLAGLCSRLDALGNPYCLGELAGQAGTFAVETLPDHINEDVLDILKSAAPLNLTANVYLLNLVGGEAEAKVITREDGSLALDLSLAMGGKDSLHRMSQALEELGGGEISLCLNRHTPLCTARVDGSIPDGHLIFDTNYTGIGGTAWNEQNRWVLDLICATVNTGFYPAGENAEAILGLSVDRVFSCPEYCRREADGDLEVPEATDFSDEAIASELLAALRTVVPGAEITDRLEYAVYQIRLNLDPEELEGDRASQYLALIYQMLLTGPVINADVYLGSEDTDFTSFRTYYNEEDIAVQEGTNVAEEYYNQVMGQIYAEDPSLKLLSQKMIADLQFIKESLRK